jgi:hypothetical protein
MLLTPYQISRIAEKPFSRYLTVAILCSDLYIEIVISLLLSDNPFSPSTKKSSLGGKGTDQIGDRIQIKLTIVFKLR